MSLFNVPKFQPQKEDIKLDEIPQNNKKFVIVHTKSLDDNDYKLLNKYGKAEAFKTCYLGLAIDDLFNKLNVEYLTIDLNDKLSKAFFESSNISTDKYNVIAIINRIHDYTLFKDDLEKITNNILHKLPAETAFKDTYDYLLLHEKLEIPGNICTCLQFSMNFFDSLKKQ